MMKYVGILILGLPLMMSGCITVVPPPSSLGTLPAKKGLVFGRLVAEINGKYVSPTASKLSWAPYRGTDWLPLDTSQAADFEQTISNPNGFFQFLAKPGKFYITHLQMNLKNTSGGFVFADLQQSGMIPVFSCSAGEANYIGTFVIIQPKDKEGPKETRNNQLRFEVRDESKKVPDMLRSYHPGFSGNLYTDVAELVDVPK